MDFRMLKHLVQQGEGERIEFKLKTNHPDKIVRELVAFANTNGGNLFLGVSDDGQIKGLKHPEEDYYLMERAIDKLCSIPLTYTAHRVSIGNNLEVLHFYIPPNTEAHLQSIIDPETHKKTVYYRVGEKSIQASKLLTNILRVKKQNKDIHINYGENERLLLKLLESTPKLTLAQYASEAHIPIKKAIPIVTYLSLANLIKILPDEPEDSITAAIN